ncbi:PREDICTED: DDB1- and CUL4-associated factor 8-like [Trachymyrmex cornetzi]|uniref:DDB1- and CUL4-associated factor 8-like n=1 Tax=Trachymyrmex cornetzi TaxID=471704 RepID=UPI00084F1AEA|nr:PREDICTED: DDB1- and CUL4-associated factor 8-like [Trachymyrmex cornetzi]
MDFEDENNKEVADYQKIRKISNWHIVPEVINRQIGSNPLFGRRFYSSLYAVEQFQLMYKLYPPLSWITNPPRDYETIDVLNFNPKGNLLACVVDDRIGIWDWAARKKNCYFFTDKDESVLYTKWLLLENCIAFSDNCSRVNLLDIKCHVSTKLATHDSCESSYALAVHPETPHVILSAGTDSKVLSIDIRESKSKELLVVKQGALKLKVALFSINSNPSNSNEFCISGRSYCVMVYDRRKVSKPLCKLWPECVENDERVSIMSAVYNYNGTEILATYPNKKLYLFNKLITSYGDYGHMYQNHVYESSMIRGNFFGPKSEYVISGSGNNIFIWDKNSESVIQYMTGDSEIVMCLDSHPHIPILATSGRDRNIKLWVPSKGELSVMQTSGNTIFDITIKTATVERSRLE